MPCEDNGRTRIQELLLNGEWVNRICRAETYDDLEVRHKSLDGSEHILSPF